MSDIIIRSMIAKDRSFIYSTFLNALYSNNEYFNCMNKKDFFEIYERNIEYILTKSSVDVKVAALTEDNEIIIGYAITENDKYVHWIYIKPMWRDMGISRSLITFTPKRVTHLTRIGKEILKKRKLKIFNPFII